MKYMFKTSEWWNVTVEEIHNIADKRRHVVLIYDGQKKVGHILERSAAHHRVSTERNNHFHAS